MQNVEKWKYFGTELCLLHMPVFQITSNVFVSFLIPMTIIEAEHI